MDSDAGKSSSNNVAKLAPPGPGITGLVVRVLDQLSLAAWLPAALLTASMAVLFRFRANENLDLGQAISDITADPLALLVSLVPLLVVTTMVTQAFSFNAIRVLEGYGRPRGILTPVRRVLIRWHVRRKSSLEKRRLTANSRAFAVARPRLLQSGFSHSVVDMLESQALETAEPDVTDEDRRVAEAMGWRSYCDPWRLASIDSIIEEQKRYPTQGRVLPTRLGNVLRSVEDELDEVGGDVGGFVMRNKNLLPDNLRADHDHYRTRLDMYAMLVAIGLILAAVSPLMLVGAIATWSGILVVSGLFILLSLTSYHAAITSATAYGSILLELNRLVKSATKQAVPLVAETSSESTYSG